MDIVKLLKDFHIPHVTEGHKHCRPGWVNMKCPYCTGHNGYHLGWNQREEYFACWRCGWHNQMKTLSLILGMDFAKIKVILENYGAIRATIKKAVKTPKTALILPSGLTALTQQHKNYLKKRKFDPEYIEKVWGVQSTGLLSNVHGSPYKNRLFIPYFWDGELVTYDTRDVTELAEDKYKACPKDMEQKERKEILYGKQELWDSIGICVEGATDVWRFGEKYTFATSGIKFTPRQVRLIAKIFKVVFVVYDNEIQAQKQAKKLAAELAMRGVIAIIKKIEGSDPGKMLQQEADEFVRQLVKEGEKILTEWMKKH